MIRLAKDKDLDAIMKIYETARKYMEETGNPSQWGKNHPPRELLEEDKRSSYMSLRQKTEFCMVCLHL